MQRAKADNLLVSGIDWAYLGLLFFLPLLMFTRASEVFEFPKMLFVYGMTVMIGAMWSARMVINRKILIAKTPLDIPILLFLLSQIISTYYSIDPHTSWWGYYSRFNGGLWSTIGYTLLYYGFVSNGQKTASGQGYGTWNCKVPYLTVPAILLAGLIVSIYAVLQHFGIDKDFWVQDVMNRVFSTQGQPNWLAGYLVMIIPTALALTSSRGNWGDKGNRGNKGYLVIGLFLLALLWSKSRSGLLGMAIADVIFWGIVLTAKLKVGKQFIYFHLILVGLILVTNNPAKQWIYDLSNIRQGLPSPAIRRATVRQGTESGDIRGIVWKGTVELIKRYPLFGTGPETFAYTYWWVRPIEHNYTSEWNFLYNKAHNEWLNLAANTGFLGLGSHILLLAWFTAWSWRSLQHRGKQPTVILSEAKNPASALLISSRLLSGLDPSSQLLRMTESYSRMTIIAILAALWGVEAVNILGFSTVTTGAYTYLFMAFAINIVKSEKLPARNAFSIADADGKVKSDQTEILKNLSLQEIGVIGVIGVIGGYLLIQIFIMFIADLGYNKGKQYADAGYVEEALPILENVVQLMPNEPVFREELGEAQAVKGLSFDSAQDSPYGKMATENFAIVRKQNPWQISFLRSQGKYIFALGETDNSLYERGIELTLQSIKLAPTDPRGYYQLGVFYEQLGENDWAKENYQEALELKLDYAEVKEKVKN